MGKSMNRKLDVLLKAIKNIKTGIEYNIFAQIREIKYLAENVEAEMKKQDKRRV